MNKKFYFGLALTAGLLASCSSDDFVSQAPGADFETNESEKTPITIGVDGISSYTRGTGSVVGTSWGGQQFEIFMFKKGTFDPAQYQAEEGGAWQDIFNNDTLTTAKGDSKAQYIVGGVEHFNYFPATGQYDFWTYRADDAGAAPVVDGDTLKIPVTINGTQDLMIGITDTLKAARGLMAAEPIRFPESAGTDSALTRIYSAYSARRGVNPKIRFSHLLTRLTFQVKAASRDVSDQADLKTEDPNEIRGFKITGVRVWSKSKGHIQAAYKCGISATNPAGVADDPASRLKWDGTENWIYSTDSTVLDANLARFELMSRKSEIDKAQITMHAIHPSVTGDISSSVTPAVESGYTLSTPSVTGTTVCYTSNALDPITGELIPANATTFADALAAGTVPVYVPAVKDGNHGDADATLWSKSISKDDPSAKLIPLVPVFPGWTGYNANAGWSVLPEAITGYTWTPVTETALTGEPYNMDAAAIAAAKTNAKTTEPTTSTEGAENEVYCFNNYGSYTFFACTAIVKNTDGATLAAADFNPETTTGTDGAVVYVVDESDNKTYYKYHEAGGSTSPGDAVITPVGESVLVAPADDHGYMVEFTYLRSLKVTGTSVKNVPGKGMINVKVADGKKFEAGKTYTVTAILYSDGEIDVNSILDTDDDGPNEDYTNGTDDLDYGTTVGGYGIGDDD